MSHLLNHLLYLYLFPQCLAHHHIPISHITRPMDTLHAAFDQYLISHPHFHLLPLLEFLPIGFHLHLSLLHLFDSVLLIDT